MEATATFRRERDRLIKALGTITDGGVVEWIQHIGSTSVPGMPTSGCIDIGVCIWPFPLNKDRVRKLARLGYTPRTGFEEGAERRFHHESGNIQLLFVESGGELWTDYLLVRDYLRDNPDASCEHKHVADTVGAARRWHIEARAFAPLETAAKELESLPCSWYISSGWSIDLFLGRVTRVHHDIDVLIARNDQLTVRRHMADAGWSWVTPHNTELKPWPESMKLELLRHQAFCYRGGIMFDFLIGEIDRGIWRFRRDLSVVRAVDRIALRSNSGIPFMGPEAALLYKSKTGESEMRPKDQADFLAVRYSLDMERRAWLRWALIATQPLHPWIEMID
jgi:GrpB-like predicted nucleotidyltransferase (UPF0157 family)